MEILAKKMYQKEEILFSYVKSQDTESLFILYSFYVKSILEKSLELIHYDWKVERQSA